MSPNDYIKTVVNFSWPLQLQTKNISEEERKTLIEHSTVLLECEMEFTEK